MQETRLTYLLSRYYNDLCSENEREELFYLVNQASNNAETEQMLHQLWLQYQSPVNVPDMVSEKVLQQILPAAHLPEPAHVPRVLFLRKWRWAAASIILALSVGAYFLVNNKENNNVRQITQITTNIPAGSNKAILSVGNDQTINLSGDKTGITVGSTITYNDGEQITDAGQMLQLSTPRGGQYQVVLPDGSKVWLNAASSIRFPSLFDNKERRVEVTGEAYFEIAKDVNRPFKVDGGGQEIEVLGTSFNVNVYADEPTRKTTLISGGIKITSNDQTAILEPGQQANISILENSKIRLIPVQTNEVVAWKNGLFNFEGLPLSSVMKQLERWYDIETKYDEKTAKLIFRGELYRNLPLKNALEILKDMGIKYELNGKTLTILGATW